MLLFILFIAFPWLASSDDILLVVAVWRHGDRSTLHPLPNDPPNLWPTGIGQLTKTGILDARELGWFVRSEYGHLIKQNYDLENIYIRSSEKDRALMTAEECMKGLFGFFGGGDDAIKFPVPIHSVPQEYDTMIRPYKNPCPNYKAYKNNLYSSSWFKNFELGNGALYKRLENLTGINNVDLFKTSHIHDNLKCKKLNNISVPSWESDSLMAEMKRLQGIKRGLQFAARKDDPGWLSVSQMLAGPFFQELLNNFDKKIQGNLSRSFIGYSGHDNTLAIIQSAMKAYNWVSPPYCASIFIELRKKGNNEYFVKFRYRNDTKRDPYDLNFLSCEAECPLSEFTSLARTVIPENRDDLCGNVNAGKCKPIYVTILLLLAFAFLGSIVLSSVLFLKYRNLKIRSTFAARGA